MTIKSDLGTASQKATALKNATDQLIQSASVAQDSQTTVAGNAKAQEAIIMCQQSATKIAQTIHAASGNIQSVAKDFEAMDNELSKSFNLGGGNK